MNAEDSTKIEKPEVLQAFGFWLKINAIAPILFSFGYAFLTYSEIPIEAFIIGLFSIAIISLVLTLKLALSSGNVYKETQIPEFNISRLLLFLSIAVNLILVIVIFALEKVPLILELINSLLNPIAIVALGRAILNFSLRFPENPHIRKSGNYVFYGAIIIIIGLLIPEANIGSLIGFIGVIIEIIGLWRSGSEFSNLATQIVEESSIFGI